MRRFLTVCLYGAMSILAGCSNGDADNGGSYAIPGKTVYLVRHAEKQTGENPELTFAGHERAEALADLLDDADIEHIFSTDYYRTLQTARPLADRLGLDIQIYDARALEQAAQASGGAEGNVLIVGHSNTTPDFVGHLGGEPGAAIVEATEYDRLYRINWNMDGGLTSEILRYGQPTLSERITP